MRQEEILSIIRKLGKATQKEILSEKGIHTWDGQGSLSNQLYAMRKQGIVDCSEERPRRWWVLE